jgi:hypothetical protein
MKALHFALSVLFTMTACIIKPPKPLPEGKLAFTYQATGEPLRVSRASDAASGWEVYQGEQKIDALSALYITQDPGFLKSYEERQKEVRISHDQALQVYQTEGKTYNRKVKTRVGVTVGGLGVAALSIALASNAGQASIPLQVGIGLGLFSSFGGVFTIAALPKKKKPIVRQLDNLSSTQVVELNFGDMIEPKYIETAAKKYNATLPPTPQPQ